MMEAIVLAGGMGTRLRSVVSEIPKPMAPVAGKPFLEYLLIWLQRHGVERVVLSVGYKWETIEQYFGSRFHGIELAYSVEDTPLGTGGAISLAMSRTTSRTVLIVNGDTIFPLDAAELLARQESRGFGATLALKRMRAFDRYGTVTLSGDQIVGFQEKSYRDEGLINGGIYAVDRDFLTGRDLPARFSFEQEILEKEAGRGRLFGMEFDASFLDIGIPEDYARAADFL